MPFNDLLSALGQKIKQNIADASDTQDAALSAKRDRLAMMLNPELQGPKVPEAGTPQEQKFDQSLIGAVSGSIAPVKGLGAALEDTAKVAASRNALNQAMQEAKPMTDIAFGTQNLGTKMALSERNAEALARAKQAALARFRGQ